MFTGIKAQQDGFSDSSSNKAYTGEMTKSSRKKLQSACDLLFVLAKKKRVRIPNSDRSFVHKIGLITLTLSAPQGEYSDKQLKKLLLEPFLRHFRKNGLYNYVWKAERQDNGNLHFHLLTDAFLWKDEVNDYWNKLQAKLGFIEIFCKKYGHRHPPSTNCKVVKTESGMVNYMLKYMLKSVQKSPQLEIGRDVSSSEVGKVWDCSLNLKMKNDTAEPVENWQFELMEKAVDFERLRPIQLEQCMIYYPAKGKIWNDAPEFLARRLKCFLKKVKDAGREDGPKLKVKVPPPPDSVPTWIIPAALPRPQKPLTRQLAWDFL